jgi:hypothetical protein
MKLSFSTTKEESRKTKGAKNNSQGSGEKPKKKAPKTAPQMNPMEDKLLCKAYVNVSTDPIKSTSQTSAQFWNFTAEKYNQPIEEQDMDEPFEC